MAYGCGYQHPANPALNIPPLYEHVGWKDFCEDVGQAYDTTEGIATEMAQLRTSWITPTKLGMKSDLVEGWDASSAQPNVSLADSPDGEQPIMANVNPETIMAAAGIGEKLGQAGGRKALARDRRPNHPLLEEGKFAKVGKDLAGELLMDACVKGDKTMVERLLGQSVDPNYQDDEESSPMMEACWFGHKVSAPPCAVYPLECAACMPQSPAADGATDDDACDWHATHTPRPSLHLRYSPHPSPLPPSAPPPLAPPGHCEHAHQEGRVEAPHQLDG